MFFRADFRKSARKNLILKITSAANNEKSTSSDRHENEKMLQSERCLQVPGFMWDQLEI